MNKNDWSNYNESNDHSYDVTKIALTDWSKVTLYRNGRPRLGDGTVSRGNQDPGNRGGIALPLRCGGGRFASAALGC